MAYTPQDLGVSILLVKQDVAPQLPLDVVLSSSVSDNCQYLSAIGFSTSVVSDLLHLSVGRSPSYIGSVVLERRDIPHSFIWGVVLRADKEVNVDINLKPYGFDGQSFGGSLIADSVRNLTIKGLDSSVFGNQKILNSAVAVNPNGLTATLFGNQSVINFNKNITTCGWISSKLGSPSTYNLKQFAPAQGKDQSSYGEPELQGGVRWVSVRGVTPSGLGAPKLLNTTANQFAKPKGIESPVVPAPKVTPYITYALGIYSTAFGSTKVSFAPTLKPNGSNYFQAGTPTVWYHTRPLSPNGFESFDTGYPKVFDPAQFIQQLPFNRTAVFGDTYAKNVWTFAKNAGAIDSQWVSDWSVVENKNRSHVARGFLSEVFGSQLIGNKSPSIFFNGLSAPVFYNHAIGYRIRSVLTTGFDHSGLGKPLVVKAPELKPDGFFGTRFGTQWVSDYTRHVDATGADDSDVSKPAIWFRFRYAGAEPWQSSKFGNAATATHGVRKMLGSGFTQQVTGTAWLSYGVRLLQPKGIYKEYPSNHYIGRHQKISPLGFVDTRFGTRIIPDSRELYPIGFVGMFGVPVTYLQTQHLKHRGYLSNSGQQAYRWGKLIVYNLTQYIIQNYDGGNGLVPPKWPDWTAIENRVKTIGAIGTAMQRFGYAQIDNNARVIEPQGLMATRINKSMITHGIRYLPLQGIEQPYMSDWLVVHNTARVIKPKGDIQTLFGDSKLVKTRRYLDRIGRIESYESGTAMIAYAIRTLNIEKRYSIAPPIIRLPTIELSTKHVGFNGYETAKYGLASLSIHFRIIKTRWSHNEKSGNPSLRNVTPDLLARGHDSQEYGDTKIRTQWRTINAYGEDSATIGYPELADTDRQMLLRGFVDSAVSQKHIVVKTSAPPYSLQYIYLNNENEKRDGYGIEPPKIDKPGINQNVLYPESEVVSSRFGTAFLWGNNLVIRNGIGAIAMPTTLIVKNKINAPILAFGIGSSGNNLGKPRLSPHTIYAVKDAPTQAKLNHRTEEELHYVGEIEGVKPPGEIFGRATVESTIRSVKANGFNKSVNIGRPTLYLRLQTIEPDSFRLSRFGLPAIPFTPQTITIEEATDKEDSDKEKDRWGKHMLSRPPYIGPQYIKPAGLYSFSSGSNSIDNFIRYLYARGHDSLQAGTILGGDTPFMWQGLRVGEHVPLIIGGDNMSLFGDTIIGLRIRDIPLKGFNAFQSNYDLSSFNDRMRVTRGSITEDEPTVVLCSGIDSLIIGSTSIRLNQHFIKPDGNSDQFRKGAF